MGWLELRDFRSYEQLRWEPDPEINVLVGDNATGKTNLLEAIGYLSSLGSFRGVPDGALVRQKTRAAVTRALVRQRDHEALIEIELPREGRRRARVNRQNLHRSSDVLGHLRAVTFLPDDLDIVKRGPSHRRALFDQAAVQLAPGAHLDQQEYDKVLRQRNTLLRREGPGADRTTLDVWDARLAAAGARVMTRRAEAIRVLLPRAAAFYRELAGRVESLEVEYRSEWGGEIADLPPEIWEDRLATTLEAVRAKDLERRVTTTGPHRDEPALVLEGREIRSLASQGEQRGVTLAFRLALHSALEERTGDRPVLLLDDVFSELDAKRGSALAELLPGGQSFVTTAREEDVPVRGRRWVVADGGIRE